MGDNEDYEDVANELKAICPKAIPDFVKMIFLDTIVANPDRHTQNFGLLRDTKTGKLLGLAPIFDHNMALISRGYPKHPKHNDLLIKLFNEFIKVNPEYKKYIPTLTEKTVCCVIDDLHMRVRTNDVVELVMGRYRLC
jgi:hypothetical protein